MESILACFGLYLSHFLLFLPTISFVSFNKAVKLYVISVHFLSLTFETTWSKIELDHQLFLSIAADNVKELPLSLKYTTPLFGFTFHKSCLRFVLFCFFFFFFLFFVFTRFWRSAVTVQWTVVANVNFFQWTVYLCTVYGPTNFIFYQFFIKNGSHGTIYTFKNYFTTVISAINFQF